MTYVVGVDSGGTHTNIKIVAPDGEEQTIPELDRSLGGNRSDQELRAVLADVMTAISGRVRGNGFTMWINAAGYAVSTRTRFEQLLREVAENGKGRLGVANDAVSLLLAHGPETVAVIAGTGSVAMARRSNGEVVVRGGDEWVVADYGSAFWIGLDGIRAAYRALEGGPETALLGCLVEHYSPLDRKDSADAIAASVREIARRLAALGSGTKPTIASFARQVSRQAEVGDDAAQGIIRKGVDELAGAAARVYRELAARVSDRDVSPRFLLNGSVSYHSPFYAEAFRASLAQFLFDVRESFAHEIELTTQLNGLSEALVLARQLAAGEPIPGLDETHPYSLIG